MTPSIKDKIYPVAKIAVIADLLAEEGIAPADALADVGLTPEQLRLPTTKVSALQVLQSCRNARKLSRDPQFAYRAGARFCVSTYGMYGFAVLSSPDFRETIAFAVAYHRLATPLTQVEFKEEGGAAAWIITLLPFPGIEAPLYEFIAKLHMGVLLSLHRKMMGPAFKPALVTYGLGHSHEDAEATSYLDCPVLYGTPENRFTFDAAWLDRRPDFANEAVHAELRQVCDDLLKKCSVGDGIAAQVRELILSSLPRPMGFEDIARRLNMSGRSLRRRLLEENTSFRQLVDELRGELAIRYVRDTDRNIEDVAFALGFSDAASFRQAFRRWTNAAPRDYRKGTNGAGHTV